MLGINMKLMVFVVWVASSSVSSITVSSNGNSPETKMLGGMIVDVQKGFVPMTSPATARDPAKTRSDNARNVKLPYNATKLSVNERYRRLIPYMTFYYANDLPKEAFSGKDVEVQKAEIVETPVEHQAKKLQHAPYRNVPRYQSNRVAQHNLGPSHATKLYKETAPPAYQESVRVTQNYHPLIEDPILEGHHFRKFKPNNIKSPSVPFSSPTRKPYLDLFHGNSPSNVRYYFADKEQSKYKLVPYEQTPPVKMINQHDYFYAPPKKAIPVPVLVNKEPVYVKQRPARPQYSYENEFIQQPAVRKPVTTVTENYYEKFRPPLQHESQSAIENGFKPILGSTEPPALASNIPQYERDEQPMTLETATAPGIAASPTPDYYQYIVDESTFTPPPAKSNTMSLGDLLDSLQLNKSIPKPITRDNVGSSIRTLLQVLNALKAVPQGNEVTTAPVIVSSTEQPYVNPEVVVQDTQPVIVSTQRPTEEPVEFQEEPYLAPVNPPSQHIDEYSPVSVTSQSFPLHQNSDDEGGTPGRPGVDYPVLTVIPPTSFNCKTQRYKGFFADPETRCQVWHYCDLNGGQASFLCPNGTIFSQAALTCDWWFNVRCASTTQLYVLNESLYKFILPHSPKFPEDYSGPLVDKYLTLKFKEMEEQFRKNKKNKQSSSKVDSSEDEESEAAETTTLEAGEHAAVSSVSEASVIVESPGTSGNVERLHD